MSQHLIPLLFILLSLALPTRGVEIIACGGSQAVIFDADQPGGENPRLQWSSIDNVKPGDAITPLNLATQCGPFR